MGMLDGAIKRAQLALTKAKKLENDPDALFLAMKEFEEAQGTEEKVEALRGFIELAQIQEKE